MEGASLNWMSHMNSSLFSVPTIEQQIESLQPGDHVCAISSGAAVTNSVVVPFVRRCLARKEMCFYVAGERPVEDVVGELTQAGINVEGARERGALTLFSGREYMPLEEFDAAAFLALFKARAQQAREAGFNGTAFLVEMTWGLELEVALDELMKYEARLNTDFFPQERAIAVCIYERQRFSALHLQAALRSHPLAIVGDKLISNPYYQPPKLIEQPSDA